MCIAALQNGGDGVALGGAGMLEGKLAVRADAAKHQGDFRKVIEGFNLTLDNVIKPLNVSAEYVDRISKGDIPPKITDTYHGDFNEIKNNLNVCIDAISRLVGDGVACSPRRCWKASWRCAPTQAKHQGDFRKIVEGFNLTLDNVIKPLNVSAEYVDRISKGDIPPKITDKPITATSTRSRTT
jgi:methyl-accepting chemotaxis protein